MGVASGEIFNAGQLSTPDTEKATEVAFVFPNVEVLQCRSLPGEPLVDLP